MKMIVAVDITNKEYAIGYKNNLQWHIPQDLKFFKEYTLGKNIIVGRETYNGLPPLKNRNIFVLTRNKELIDNETYYSKDEILKMNINEDFIVCGGKQIYIEFFDEIDEFCINEIYFKNKSLIKKYDTFLLELFNKIESDKSIVEKEKNIIYEDENYQLINKILIRK